MAGSLTRSRAISTPSLIASRARKGLARGGDVADRDRHAALGRRLLVVLALGLVAVEGIGAQHARLARDRRPARLSARRSAIRRTRWPRWPRAAACPWRAPPSLSMSFCLRLGGLAGADHHQAGDFQPLRHDQLERGAALAGEALGLGGARHQSRRRAPAPWRWRGPNLSPSSQNTMRTPLVGAAKGPNPSFRASDIGEILILGVRRAGALRLPYGAAAPPLQSPKSLRFPGFSPRLGRRVAGRGCRLTPDIACLESSLRAARTGPAAFYFLLCMFNGFAFARPLCR